MAETHKTILSPSGDPASLIFESGTIRNPGKSNEETFITNNQNGMGINNFGGGIFGGIAEGFGHMALSSIETFRKNLRGYFVSKFYTILAQAYSEYGLVRTIVDVPVEDGFRGGVKWLTDQLDEKDLTKLRRWMKRLRDLSVAMRAIKWARLFGGGAVIAIVKDQDPEEPLDLDAIGPDSKVEFRAVNMWEIMPGNVSYAQTNPTIPTDVINNPQFDFFLYYGEKIHHSRVHRIMGLDVPSIVKWQLLGWGASILEPFIRPFNQFLKASDLTFEVLDEFKLDVFFIQGFKEAMASDEAFKLMQKRIHFANGRKNFQNATILSEQDKFEQRQLTFAGLAEVSQMNLVQIAAVARMPLTKIFGISAAGFSTGQEDLENYNMLVESTVREPAEDVVMWMADIRCQELFNDHPDDLEVEFQALRVLGGVEEQAVKTGKAQILDAARNRGDINAKEYREASNAGKLIDLSLDTSDAVMDELEAEAQPMDGEELGGEAGGTAGKSKGGAPSAPKPKEKGKSL